MENKNTKATVKAYGKYFVHITVPGIGTVMFDSCHLIACGMGDMEIQWRTESAEEMRGGRMLTVLKDVSPTVEVMVTPAVIRRMKKQMHLHSLSHEMRQQIISEDERAAMLNSDPDVPEYR
jgi:hypothetical protein